MNRELDEKRICFITAVNDEAKYQKCRESINQLLVPTGFQVEFQPMRGFSSMTDAYEAGRLASDAKYKIYLHQDVELQHRQLLKKLVQIFADDPQWGILGVVGSATIPADGVWWESPELLGMIDDDHTGQMQSYRYQAKERQCLEARALDGLFLATQYDVAWRRDIFRHWHFYDLSQCLEFQRLGYKVGVVGQRMPWCRHYCGQNPMNGYDEERRLFLKEYGRELAVKPEMRRAGEEFTSIVILSYNTFDYTRLCIESIRRFTATGSYEIIVVDNGSRDQSRDWLRQQSDIRCIFNERNEGFPRGCNQGMAVAQGTELLLLNSDTIVTPRWLEQLREALHSRDSVGAVSCVTNKCSNGQEISVPEYGLPEGLISFAEEYNHTDASRWVPFFKLVAFCLLIKREAYEKIGPLDEIFTPGNYEDDDYSMRLRQAGYTLLLCQDTFIHHFRSTSFWKGLSPEEREAKQLRYKELLERNAQLFREKWRLAGGYADVSWLLFKLPEKLPKGARILVVGCSYGADLFYLAQKYPGAEINGIAVTPREAEVANWNFAVQCCQDIEHGVFSLLSGLYDGIIIPDLLAGFQDAASVVDQLSHWLTPGGNIYFNLGEQNYAAGVVKEN